MGEFAGGQSLLENADNVLPMMIEGMLKQSAQEVLTDYERKTGEADGDGKRCGWL